MKFTRVDAGHEIIVTEHKLKELVKLISLKIFGMRSLILHKDTDDKFSIEIFNLITRETDEWLIEGVDQEALYLFLRGYYRGITQ